MCTAHRAEQRQWTKPLTESAAQATPSTLRRSADIRRQNRRFRALSHRKAAPQRCITTKVPIPSHSMRMAVRVRRRVSRKSISPMQPCQLQRLLAQDTPSRAGERVLPLPMRHISRDQHSIRMQTRRCMQSGLPGLIPSVIMPTAGSGGPGVTNEKHTASKILISRVEPTRSGYTFLGWSTSPSATSASYQPGEWYYANADRILYAVWKKNAPATYTVSYDANGGSGAPGSQTKTENVTLTLSPVSPRRTGYTFKGWATNKFMPGAQYQPAADIPQMQA